MANSRFEYVKSFERESYLLPSSWIVIRVDGRGFHKFSDKYKFAKPNDIRALNLMNAAAKALMNNITEVILAYGDSDEYSFVLGRNCQLFERREAKLVSTFASTFTANYITLWNQFFSKEPLDPTFLPTFDSRAVLYPTDQSLRDYLAWRQADCHINNLYNTSFWALVLKGGMTPNDAESELCGTISKDKHEILFTRFGINYNAENEMFKKGTLIIRELKDIAEAEMTATPVVSTHTGPAILSKRQLERIEKRRRKADINVLHTDIIKDDFWLERSWILKG
ncbi:tRNAHis guanylyltransferase [Nadsonia fulvescens var. elongata DSM 6958]|uniref:tRNA(His) guanylyltransferase n=1 Tax=Nadsonia fulvescens var. elongata DSM 6958 TaxID=857566 RepID=A0A1E3PLC1_9ASCO|nr:tRNAHis guanylyltransferase [Nadsonia fulvescens var. elongata DSM 6958]